MSSIIGIDLGTTYSAVSIYEKKGADGPGAAIVIRNLRGKETTPSVVSVNNDQEIIVGEAAKNNLEQNPKDTVLEIKRLMGHSPEQVKLATGGRGVVIAGREYLPEQVSAFILRDLKAAAEHYLGEKVFDAIITCPAYFGENQKAATKRAGLLAGLNVHKVLPEPVAAAIAYGVEKASKDDQTFVIYDLGGGTFDVSVITVDENDIQVAGTAGDAQLGGANFDDIIVDWVIGEVKNQHGVDLTGDKAARARIKTKAEEAKIQLSAANSADMNIPFITIKNGAPIGGTFTLSRAKFELMIMRMLKKTVESVKEAIDLAKAKDSDITEDAITAILLVGGSSRIPRIKQMLTKEFPNIEVRADLNPDHIVAQGAALAASNLVPVGKPPTLDGKLDVSQEAMEKAAAEGGTGIEFAIYNVVSHSLGIAVGAERKFLKILARNADIPATNAFDELSCREGQVKVKVEVYEGEGEFVDAPNMSPVGEYLIEGWEPGPEGSVRFKVEFSMDINGILSVTTTEMKNNIQVTGEFNRKDLVGTKSIEELQSQVQQVKQAGLEGEGQTATTAKGRQPALDQGELALPPGLNEEFEGYWQEAASRLPKLKPELAARVKESLGALREAARSGDTARIKSAGNALVEITFELP